MHDPFTPTSSEITAWAYAAGSTWPVRDWDLIVTSLDTADLLLRLASDAGCPKRAFFLRCLYLLVGDMVRAALYEEERGDPHASHTFLSRLDRPASSHDEWQCLDGFLRRAEAGDDDAIRRWVARSRHLIAHPDEFDYYDWCDGGLAEHEETTGTL